MKHFFKLLELSESRVKFFVKNKDNWYSGSDGLWEELKKELKEAENEYREGNSVCLEDELGDVLWDYLGLLNSLVEEWKIKSVKRVLERAYNKFSERIDVTTWRDKGDWDKVKEKQKQTLKQECDNNKD